MLFNLFQSYTKVLIFCALYALSGSSTSLGLLNFIDALSVTILRLLLLSPVSPQPSSLFFWGEEAETAFTRLKSLFTTQTPAASSKWRWMPRTPVLGWCCRSGTRGTRSYTSAPSSAGGCTRLNPTTTWVIGNCWQWCSCCRSGDIGWRARHSRSCCGLTTEDVWSDSWPDLSDVDSGPILSSSCIVGAVT